MPVLTAPNTGETIEVLSTTEVVGEIQKRVPWPAFHANYLAKLEQKGKFPEPWLEIGGRKGWLRQDIETWIEERSSGARKKREEEAAALYGDLDERELNKALAELKKRILEGKAK